MGQILVTGFQIEGESQIRDTFTGEPIQKFEGICEVFFNDGTSVLYKTGLNQYGERYWLADGNNPAKKRKYQSVFFQNLLQDCV